ncbi:hypothetical protein OK016_27430 [Vibrio chagasii]|nr:hypothetical protein [Vibrio chagasii]
MTARISDNDNDMAQAVKGGAVTEQHTWQQGFMFVISIWRLTLSLLYLCRLTSDIGWNNRNFNM